ncbi:hypothetical protein CONPUDRAFT_151563 [Coniophora puteana RWD-64-598 SS2]|uniref:Uncharacterized protein n=1 Tax=Coniophora puteana (strain RWD-64-598) TaxID=741705 RepID=A0A5M3MZX4_CONPW|nr:uncharacterized protein CONPUDRAFT_151563 [Coniophora puteana RWD-64-598 SS2]EIW84547.1 hypothetical protein CONPUDRAFT_151563 [Coniophora puteana RWD-64-598 SS2]
MEFSLPSDFKTVAPFNKSGWKPSSHRRPPEGRCWQPYDARVLGITRQNVLITSPNASYIPPYRPNPDPLRARADGNFGLDDPFLLPTMHCVDLPWAALYPSRAYWDGFELTGLWWTPTEDDIEAVPRNGVKVGPLKATSMARLEELFRGTMRDKRDRLRARLLSLTGPDAPRNKQWVDGVWGRLEATLDNLRFTSGDLSDRIRRLGDFRRGCMDLWAYAEYRLRVASAGRLGNGPCEGAEIIDGIIRASPRYVGAYTTHPNVLRGLYEAGVPVWFPRSPDSLTPETHQLQLVEIDSADWIVEDPPSIQGERTPFPLIVDWPLHPCRLWMARYGYGFSSEHSTIPFDGRVPCPETRSNGTQAGPSRFVHPGRQTRKPYDRASKSKGNDRNKKATPAENRAKAFKVEDIDSPAFSGMFTLWERALNAAKRSTLPPDTLREGMDGYRFPNPAWFVGTALKEKYLKNWLIMRPLWIEYIHQAMFNPSLDAIGTGSVHVLPGAQGTSHAQTVAPAALPNVLAVPNSQGWRDMLGGQLFRFDPDRAHTVTSVQCVAALACFAPVWKRLQALLAAAEASGAVHFRGIRLPLNVLDKELVLKWVIWDLHDISLAPDFVGLDRAMVPEAWASGYEARKQACIAAFPYTLPVVNAEPDTEYSHWGAPRHGQELITENLRALVSRWPCASSKLGIPLNHDELTGRSPHGVAQLDSEMTELYAVWFRKRYNRAPILPHVKPNDRWISELGQAAPQSTQTTEADTDQLMADAIDAEAPVYQSAMGPEHPAEHVVDVDHRPTAGPELAVDLVVEHAPENNAEHATGHAIDVDHQPAAGLEHEGEHAVDESDGETEVSLE